MKVTIASIVLFFAFIFSCAAQSTYSVKGVVVDTVVNSKIRATVTVLNGKDSILLKFSRSNTDGSYVVSGSAQVHDINQHLPFLIEEDVQYDTLAGIIIGKAGGLPAEGDVVRLAGYEATIIRKTNNRIMQVRLVPHDPEDLESDLE